MSTKQIAALLLAVISARCDIECPAIQKAIDDMAEPFREGRRGLLSYLRQEAMFGTPATSMNSLCNYMSQDWAKVDLKRATGRTREQWGF